MRNSLALNTPIACSLEGGDFRKRTAWIQSLAREHLKSARRDRVSLHLSYAPEARAAVKTMVEQERDCCGFMRFELRESDNSVDLTITAPEGAADVAGVLFDHFAPDLRLEGGRP